MSSERGRSGEEDRPLLGIRELRESEVRYRSLFENSADAIFLTKPDGRVLAANHAAQQMFGMTEEELIAAGRDGILVKDERLAWANGERSESSRVTADLTYRRKDGSTFPGEVSSSTFVDADGTLSTMVSVRDITSRKKAEEELKASEERLAFFLKLSDALRPVSDPLEVQEVVARVVMDHFRVDRCYYTEFVDGDAVIRRESKKEGLPPVAGVYEMSKLPIFQAVVDAGHPLVVRDAKTSDVLDESLRQMCVQLQVISFIDVPVIKNGKAVGILNVVHGEPREWTDLEVELAVGAAERTWEAVERGRAEEALEGSEAKYRGIFENSRDTISTRRLLFDEDCTIIDSIIVDANPAALRAWGLGSVDEIKGRRPSEIFGPEAAEVQLASIKQAISRDEPFTAEVSFVGRDYLSTFVPLGGDLVLITSSDVTGIKKAQRESEEYAKQLKRSNEELQQFAYVASHDLQEPLRMVTTYLSLLKKQFGSELSPQAKEYMSIAVDGSMRMRSLIDDLLQYSRVDSQPIELEEVDMNKVARSVEEDLHVAIKDAGAEFIVGPLPTVRAEETQMKQLLTNLMSNAIKFHGKRPSRVEVSAVTCGGAIVFLVRDNGIGIDPKYADKLFKMFSRLHTSKEYPGTGIGLAIAKKIVERHGGRIWFESEVGKGTTFYFSIPA